MKVLEVNQLSHSYGETSVLNDISFQIEKGQCYSLLGPNGAGKSTCISIILNHLIPQVGEVKIQGRNISNFSSKYFRSCTPQDARFPDGIKAIDLLRFIAKLYPQPLSEGEIITELGLEKIVSLKTQVLSGGQRSLLSLACAFIANTDLVLLDEPTTGLDIETRFKVWDYIHKYKNTGGSILLTTHHLEEAEFLCDEVGFLYQGCIVKSGSFSELKNETLTKKVSFYHPQISKLNGYKFIEIGKDYYYFESQDPKKDLQPLLMDPLLEDIRVEDIGLEKLFVNMISNGRNQS